MPARRDRRRGPSPIDAIPSASCGGGLRPRRDVAATSRTSEKTSSLPRTSVHSIRTRCPWRVSSSPAGRSPPRTRGRRGWAGRPCARPWSGRRAPRRGRSARRTTATAIRAGPPSSCWRSGTPAVPPEVPGVPGASGTRPIRGRRHRRRRRRADPAGGPGRVRGDRRGASAGCPDRAPGAASRPARPARARCTSSRCSAAICGSACARGSSNRRSRAPSAGPLTAVQHARMRPATSARRRARARRSARRGRAVMFRPLQPMLASPARGRGRDASSASAAALGEDKYDGIRAQLHKLGRCAAVQPRSARHERQLPEVAEAASGPAVGRHPRRRGACLDRDGMACRSSGSSTGLGAKTRAAAMLEAGAGRLRRVRRHRARTMCRRRRAVVPAADSPARRTPRAARRAAAAGRTVHGHRELAASARGARPASSTRRRRAATRGWWPRTRRPTTRPAAAAWLAQAEEALATLDCVVVGVEVGHGKRHGVLSDYTFAVRDDRPGREGAPRHGREGLQRPDGRGDRGDDGATSRSTRSSRSGASMSSSPPSWSRSRSTRPSLQPPRRPASPCGSRASPACGPTRRPPMPTRFPPLPPWQADMHTFTPHPGHRIL